MSFVTLGCFWRLHASRISLAAAAAAAAAAVVVVEVEVVEVVELLRAGNRFVFFPLGRSRRAVELTFIVICGFHSFAYNLIKKSSPILYNRSGIATLLSHSLLVSLVSLVFF